jgi:hypothetical protein
VIYNHRTEIDNAGIGWGILGLGFAFLTGVLLWSGPTHGGDQVPPAPAAANKASALAAVQMIFHGPDELVAGQRATLEVFLLNTGTSSIKDLEFVAKLDANLEPASKETEFRVAVEPIAADDIQVVRLQVTPKKVGPGGMDVTLRDRSGASTEVRRVWPVALQDPSRQAVATAGTSPLKFKITALRPCCADRPGIVLVNIVNSDSRPMAEKRELVVSYASLGRNGQVIGVEQPPSVPLEGPRKPAPIEGPRKGGPFAPMPMPISTNPTREVKIMVPALAPGESHTIPVRLTPRRIGDLGIAVTASAIAKEPPVLATARLKVKFDPKLTPEQFIPVRADAVLAPRLPKTLAEVPEVSLEDSCAPMKPEEAFEYVSHLVEKINQVNTTRTDAFVETMTRQRADMRGLPFVMGDDCRLPQDRGQQFLNELNMLRGAMGNPANLAAALPNPASQPATDTTIQARIAAITQVVGPEGEQMGRQAVKYLASLSHVRSTTALAKIAIFAEEDSVRRDALAALATRREKDFADILLAGLNYPWPAVAQRSADAIVQLKCQDLLPQLVHVLDRPDPRAPETQTKDGKQVTVVREMVRINHLRNCLLCHSPVDPSKAPAAADVNLLQGRGEGDALRESRRGLPVLAGLTAPVPLPGQTLPPSSQGGYGQFSVPDTLVMFDVTYLRQDFSVKLDVANAKPWPEKQRFDFLVRTREVTDKEADAYRDLLRKEGEQSPYHRAALTSLRKLTGRDTEPTAAAWRRLLADAKPGEK